MKVRLYMAYFCGACGILIGAFLAHNPIGLGTAFGAVVIVMMIVALLTHRHQ